MILLSLLKCIFRKTFWAVVSNWYSVEFYLCFDATHNRKCCKTSNLFWFNWDYQNQTVKILLTAITQSSPFVSVKKHFFAAAVAQYFLCWGYISLRRSVFRCFLVSVCIWMMFLKADCRRINWIVATLGISFGWVLLKHGSTMRIKFLKLRFGDDTWNCTRRFFYIVQSVALITLVVHCIAMTSKLRSFNQFL